MIPDADTIAARAQTLKDPPAGVTRSSFFTHPERRRSPTLSSFCTPSTRHPSFHFRLLPELDEPRVDRGRDKTVPVVLHHAPATTPSSALQLSHPLPETTYDHLADLSTTSHRALGLRTEWAAKTMGKARARR